jgi:hypothetical protein
MLAAVTISFIRILRGPELGDKIAALDAMTIMALSGLHFCTHCLNGPDGAWRSWLCCLCWFLPLFCRSPGWRGSRGNGEGGAYRALSAGSGGISFTFSQLLAMKQVSVRRMLGYSSIGQIGLLTTVAALAPILTPAFSRAEGSGLLSGLLNGSLGGFLGGGVFPLLVLLAGNHLFSKAGLFWMRGITGSVDTGGLPDGSSLRRAPAAAGLQGLLTASLAGFPPFSGILGKTASDHDACFNR